MPHSRFASTVRYDFVAHRSDDRSRRSELDRGYGLAREASQPWRALRWEAGEETLSVVHGSAFIDVTSQAIGQTESFTKQLASRSRLLANGPGWSDRHRCLCNNGVAAGDFDNDGFDDFYVCQPAGLPNRLYRNRGDGTFEDVTQRAGVGVLDNTACALFADFDNRAARTS